MTTTTLELRYVKTFDPAAGMNEGSDADAVDTDRDHAAILARIEDDAAHIAADCGYTWTINTDDNLIAPRTYYLTMHWPDGSHQTDTFAVLSDDPTDAVQCVGCGVFDDRVPVIYPDTNGEGPVCRECREYLTTTTHEKG